VHKITKRCRYIGITTYYITQGVGQSCILAYNIGPFIRRIASMCIRSVYQEDCQHVYQERLSGGLPAFVSGGLPACVSGPVLCTWRLTASMVNDADGVMYVKLTVKIVNYAANRQSLVTVTPLFTIVIYGAIFEWRRMCTTLIRTVYQERSEAFRSVCQDCLLAELPAKMSVSTYCVRSIPCILCA